MKKKTRVEIIPIKKSPADSLLTHARLYPTRENLVKIAARPFLTGQLKEAGLYEEIEKIYQEALVALREVGCTPKELSGVPPYKLVQTAFLPGSQF